MKAHTEKILDTVGRDGFTFIAEWMPHESSESVAAKLGSAIRYGRESTVHRLRPHAIAAPNTYSGIYGLAEFPFHSDMAHWRAPPRFLMLRCVSGSAGVKANLLDGDQILEFAGEDLLSRALVKPRRPLNGIIPIFPLYRAARCNDGAIFRWDENFIIPASSAGRKGVQLVRDFLRTAKCNSVSLCEPGDTLIIDNWCMLHGRSAVSNGCDRIVDRAYFGELY